MEDPGLSVWTTYLDYAATGEGRTLMARVCWAATEEDARAQFAAAFGPYFAAGCVVSQGVTRNEVTRFLWSDQALRAMEQLSGGAAFQANSGFHFNIS